jgi:hypothetical protein
MTAAAMLPDFDAPYRAAIAAAAACHLPTDIARVAASYAIDDERIRRQQQYLADHAGNIWWWMRAMMEIYPAMVATIADATHLCVRPNGPSVAVHCVRGDLTTFMIETQPSSVLPIVWDPCDLVVCATTTPLSAEPHVFEVMVMDVAVRIGRTDEWGNVWVGEPV